MTTPNSSYRDVTRQAASRVLSRQPWFVRRKDSLTAAAGTILQVLNLAVLVGADWPEWVNIAIAVVVGLAQIIIHAGTKAPMAPSLVDRVADEADRVAQPDDGYVGEHRKSETPAG